VPQRLELASQLDLVPLDGAQVIESGPDAEGRARGSKAGEQVAQVGHKAPYPPRGAAPVTACFARFFVARLCR
jgi:hypothetical protein